jgi:hypothetical protein
MKLTNITAPQHRCTIGACPAVYTDLTPAEYRCEISVSCPAVLRTEGRYVIIGKRIDPEAEGLSGKVSESETAAEIPAEILLSALGVTELIEAVESILSIPETYDHHDDPCRVVPAEAYFPLRSIIDRIKGGVNG